MRSFSIHWLNLIVLLIALVACQDHRIPQGQRFRLKRASASGLRSYNSTLFNYSADGHIDNYVDSNSDRNEVGAATHTTTLTYNSLGQLVSAQGQSINSHPIRYTYEYDTKGNIISVNYYVDQNNSGKYTVATSYDLVYSTTSFPDLVIRKIYDGLGSARQTTQEQYTYTNGNVVSVYDSSIGASTNYTYTDKVNPFYGLIYGVPTVGLYSKNVADMPGFVDTYDANGLLVKRFRSGGAAASQNDYTQTYEYEAY